MKLNRNILCVDAGFRNLGVAVYSSTLKKFCFVDCFSNTKDSTKSVADDARLTVEAQVLYLDAIVEHYGVQIILSELPTGASRSSRAIRGMAIAFATIVAYCKARKIRLVVIKPSEIKRLAGFGAVSKLAVQRFVQRRFGVKILDSVKKTNREHVADAIACLVVYQNRHERSTP